MKTYDISDECMNLIKATLKHTMKGTPVLLEEALAELEPTCEVGDRIVTNVQSFRDWCDCLIEEEQEVIAAMSDEELEGYVPDLYDDWSKWCDSAVGEIMMQHRHKNKETTT